MEAPQKSGPFWGTLGSWDRIISGRRKRAIRVTTYKKHAKPHFKQAAGAMFLVFFCSFKNMQYGIGKHVLGFWI